MEGYSLTKLIQGLQSKAFSSNELTQYYLSRIARFAHINAFISIDPETALQEAAKADGLLNQDKATPLTGIPMAHKDIFCTLNMPTTCGSKMLANFIAPYEATIVKKMRNQGMVLLGKTNMDEFAMGSTNENSHFGPVKNPWNVAHVPGGSSGGSAASVAARLVPFATGSDTGGSIRQPAAFCNLTGLKPTYGLISRFGMIAYASSFDQAGLIAQSAEDIATILPSMAGFDPLDSTSVNQPIPNYLSLLGENLRGLRMGLPSCFFNPNVESAVQEAIHHAIKLFEKLGAKIIPIELSLQDLWVPCYYVIACAEASSNLARYDGIRFGYRCAESLNLKQFITTSRSEGFGLEVQRRILTGTYVLSSGYFDAYYIQAQKVRRKIQNELCQTLSEADVIIGPTTPTCAFVRGELGRAPTQRYLEDVFTVAANLAGLPALSLPVGFNLQGLPIGMQLMGPHFSETKLLNIAHQYQQETPWHLKRPKGDL